MPTNLIRKYVEPGACIAKLQNGNAILTACALEPEWCPQSAGIAGRKSDEFVSSRQLHQNGPNTPGHSCLASDGTDPRHYVRLGRCASAVDNYVCTSVADNCMNGAAFESTAEMCTLLVDLAPDRKDEERTLFSGCHNPLTEPVYCYWSGADCPTDQGFQTFGARPYSHFLECPCEKTQVGACQSNDSEEYFCAPSPESCDPNSTFINVKDLQNTAGIDCRLCMEPSLIPDPISTGTPGRPTTTGSPGNSANTSPILPSAAADSGISNATIGAIVGGVLGGLLLAAIVAIVVHSVRRRRGRSQGKTGGTAIVVELAAEVSRTTSEANQSSCDVSSLGGTASEVERAEYL